MEFFSSKKGCENQNRKLTTEEKYTKPSRLVANRKNEVEEGITAEETGGPLDMIADFKCQKHKNDPDHHKKFIKATEISLMSIPNLPDGCPVSRDLLYKYVKSAIPLVGRIHGRIISNNRPESCYGVPYIFWDSRGQLQNTCGSGWVYLVRKRPEDPCVQGKSHQNVTSSSPCWEIIVLTARHVIFDDKEGSVSDFVLFDDNDNGSNTLILNGGRVNIANTEMDFSFVTYTTYNQTLA